MLILLAICQASGLLFRLDPVIIWQAFFVCLVCLQNKLATNFTVLVGSCCGKYLLQNLAVQKSQHYLTVSVGWGLECGTAQMGALVQAH